MNLRSERRALVAAAMVIGLTSVTAVASAADEDDAQAKPSEPSNKLTIAYYAFSSDKRGADINLRHSFSSSTAWVGIYHENDGFDQARVGYEYDYRRDWLTFVPTALAASHGFFGATVYGEVGREVFAIGGAGRTNLKPYWNLAFDPNDYIQFGAGYRDAAGNTISVYAIRDNRLDTGQTNIHLYFRRHLPDGWRLTLDVVNERGDLDDGSYVKAWSVSVVADWRRWFIHVAADPHVNYTPENQIRISSGWRF